MAVAGQVPVDRDMLASEPQTSLRNEARSDVITIGCDVDDIIFSEHDPHTSTKFRRCLLYNHLDPVSATLANTTFLIVRFVKPHARGFGADACIGPAVFDLERKLFVNGGHKPNDELHLLGRAGGGTA